jgi:hypothetical protein
MVEFLKLNKPLSEARVRAISDLYPGGWHLKSGTAKENAAMVLEGSDAIQTRRHHGIHATNVLKHVSRHHPAIVFIDWLGAGFHAAVCSHAYHDGTFVFLDPFFGLAELSSDDLPAYDGAKGQLYQDTLGGPILGTIIEILTT